MNKFLWTVVAALYLATGDGNPGENKKTSKSFKSFKSNKNIKVKKICIKHIEL